MEETVWPDLTNSTGLLVQFLDSPQTFKVYGTVTSELKAADPLTGFTQHEGAADWLDHSVTTRHSY